MKFIVKIVLLILFPCYLFAKDINVYLRFDDPVLYQSIKQFNGFLESKNFFSRYQIQPFLKNHPLHITLYLASYPEGQLEQIKNQVSQIARLSKPIKAKTTTIFLTSGNYLMLDLDMNTPLDKHIHHLQRLSDLLVINLSSLRDINAKIPDWAESLPEKKKAFMRYGSPNVFFEYNPHFTLMAKNFIDSEEEKRFQNELNQLIQEYNFPELNIESLMIGIGYVDFFGQITEEINSYPLSGK